MAFVAKDGSKHTNHDSMRHANARHASKTEHEPEHEGEHEPEEGGEQEPEEFSSPDELQGAFEQHMQEHLAGAPHEPHNARRLANHFSRAAENSIHEAGQ